jgi:hypothetical protein
MTMVTGMSFDCAKIIDQLIRVRDCVEVLDYRFGGRPKWPN